MENIYYHARGHNTGQIYYTKDSEAAIIRQINQDYPWHSNKRPQLPEPLWVEGVAK